MANTSPKQFIDQVRQEAGKVTWSTKKEVTTSTMMVMVVVAIASVFFLFVDWASFGIVQLLLGLGR